MLSMKNWHGNWLESVLDVLDMLFLYYDPVWYTFLFACHEISLSASLILSYSNIRASLTTLLKRSSEGERTFYHGKSVQLRCFSLKRSLYRLIYQSNCQVSITLGNTGARNFQMRKIVCQMACPPPHCLPRIRIHFFEN